MQLIVKTGKQCQISKCQELQNLYNLGLRHTESFKQIAFLTLNRQGFAHDGKEVLAFGFDSVYKKGGKH